MHTTKYLIAVLVAGFGTHALVTAEEDETKADANAMEGYWDVVSVEFSGRKLEGAGRPDRVIILGGKMTFFAKGKADKEVKNCKLQVDGTRKQKSLDLCMEGEKVSCIYEFGKDELKLAMPISAPGQTSTRPESFQAEGKPVIVLVARKVPPEKMLPEAKKSYEVQTQQHRKRTNAWLDEEERGVRRSGVESHIERHQAERKLFEETSRLPLTAPADLRLQPREAWETLVAAYRSAIRDYTGAKQLDKVKALEEELETFPKRGTSDTLLPGQKLTPGEYLLSRNGRCELVLQDDGNLAVYRLPGRIPLWGSKTNGQKAVACVMQGDGNLVLFGPKGIPLWSSKSEQNPGAFLVVQDDSNVVIQKAGKAIWATNTKR